MKRKLNQLRLNKIKEVSLCTSFNPPANGFKTFEIIKSEINKEEYYDLFEELQMPEYGEFVSYLSMWLEEDVNRVAYNAFLDALFNSLQDVVYDSTLDKAGKLLKFQENFDKFIQEYENSVITKSKDGKVMLNAKKLKDIDIKKYYGECIAEECGEDSYSAKTFSELISECAPDRINNMLWDMFVYKLNDKIFDIHYLDEKKYSKQDKAKMLGELFAEFVENFNNTELIKSKSQEKDMSKTFMEKLQNLITEFKKNEEEVKEEVKEEVLEEKPEEKVEEKEVESQETKEEEVSEDKEPESEEKPESEEPKQEENPVESEEDDKKEEVAEEKEVEVETEEPKVEAETEEVEEATDTELEKATKENEDLMDRIIKLEKANEEKEIKLEKAELMKEVSKDFYGLPKTKEEIVEVIYELNKSALSKESKEFITESLKSLSNLNKDSFEEQGHSEEVDANLTDSEKILEKANKLVSEHNIDESQAVLVAKGKRTLEKAIEVSKKLGK